MKNLKNIIASIILVAISFVSYTQTNTLKYEFYLTDSTNAAVDTFNVSNTENASGFFSLSKDTLNLGGLNSSMNFSMSDIIYQGANYIIDNAHVTKIFLFKNDIDYTQNEDALTTVVNGIDHDTTSILEISPIDSLIPTLIDGLEYDVKYKNLIFIIEGSTGFKSVNVAIDYHLAPEEGTASIDTEVIEVSNTRVYPNPVMNSLNIEFETINTDTEVEIYSTSGQLMYKDVEYRNFGINKVSVDMSNYQPGMYIVRLGNEVKKVIKQ